MGRSMGQPLVARVVTKDRGSRSIRMTTVVERRLDVWQGKIRANVKVAGNSSPIVFLHGAGGLVWDGFLDRLSERHTVYAPEFPGTAAGDPDAISHLDNLWDLVLYYNDLLDALGLRSAQIKMIWSMACTGKFVWPIPDKGLHKRIHRIQAPTLVVWGKQDRLVPPPYAQEFAQRIPGSRVEMIDHAGHVLGLEHPARLAE